METNKRTLILAGILAAVLGFGMGWPVFMQPVRDAERDLVNAEKDLEDASADDMQLQLARKRIGDAMAVSLPPSLNDAQRLYLEWITDLTQECRFAQVSVLPGGRQPRGGRFLLVSVVVEAEASLKDFARFLFHFKQADLLHRIKDLNVVSTGSSGRPRVEITFTAEGMSVIGSDDKAELAARVPLQEALDPETTLISVSAGDDFPSKVPFLTKIDQETVRVTGRDGDSWTVERGVDGSEAMEHSESAIVRHFPVAWNRRDRRFEDYEPFLGESLFTKPPVPREYFPELAGLDDVTVAPGEAVSLTARVDDYNVDIGDVSFSLKDSVDGMTIDATTGQLEWETAEDQAPADYSATVVAVQKNNPDLSLEQSITVSVKLPNDPPELSVTDQAVVFLGQQFQLTPKATDDGDVSDLTWTLEGDDLPEGLEVNSDTGILTWQPALTVAPGSHTVTLTVTDQGDPQESASASVTLEVKDDDARFTRLTATVKKDGRPEAWFENSRSNSQDVLHVGDQLTVANIEAEIVDIEARFVTLRDNEGDWQLALGNIVRDRVLASAADSESAEEATAEQEDEVPAQEQKSADEVSI